MAIQFPPIAAGDPEPLDGNTFLYVITQEEFVCKRRSLDETPQWSCRGTFRDSTFAYAGTLEIQQPAPNAPVGAIYSVSDGGIADASFGSLAGVNIEQWSLVIATGTDWALVSSAQTGPWLRTVGGRIQPAIQTDNLDMAQGNYLINELPDLGVTDNVINNVSITLQTNSWAGTDALNIRFHSCTATGAIGINDSPALSWTVTGDVPAGATFRIRCLDVFDGTGPDGDGFIHWSVDNINSATTSIAENGALPAGATANVTDFGGGDRANGWNGPCPPPDSGDHNYNFTIELVDANGDQIAISNTLTSTIPT